MESIYLETSFISYLVAKPSRDLVIAAHQSISMEWWTLCRGTFDCYISQFVLDEAGQGDEEAAQRRLKVTEDIAVLDVTREAEDLTQYLLGEGLFPQKAVADAAHLAIATTHEVDFLLTWNCKHLANAHISKKVRGLCRDRGFDPPVICTPEELMEDSHE